MRELIIALRWSLVVNAVVVMISFRIDGMPVIAVIIFAVIATIHVLILRLQLNEIVWFAKSTSCSTITQSIPVL